MNFNSNGNLNFNHNNKSNEFRVRPVLACLYNITINEKKKDIICMMNRVQQLSLFPPEEMGGFSLQEVLRAYRVCLRGKGGTVEAQKFSYRYMSECVQLWRSLNDQSYQLSLFIAFISFYPVMREIYGSKFVDRLVDTIIYLKLLPPLELQFVIDNYSTRKDKGSLFGARRIAQMIYEVSEGYTRDCWILKDDIKSFFMSMEKQRVMDNWTAFVHENYHEADAELIIATLRKIVFFRPELNCIRKGSLRDWDPMPPDKLLGSQGSRRGFPIGKVISQLSALMFLDAIDHIITYVWKIRNGHYMDDRVMVDKSREKLLEAKKELDMKHEEIGLRTHPRKTYLQHYSKGVLFGGAMILPGRIYVSNRTVGNCFRRLSAFNHLAQTEPGYVEQHAEEFAQVMNSYFGQMGHYAEWNTVHRVIREIGAEWYRVMMVVGKRGRYKVHVHPSYCLRRTVVRKHRCRMITLLNDNDRTGTV